MQMTDVERYQKMASDLREKGVRNEVSSYARNSKALLSAMPQWPGDLKKPLTKPVEDWRSGSRLGNGGHKAFRFGMG
jgi:hypothetical protein